MQVHRRRKDESRAFCSPILHVVNRKRKCACKSLIAVCESLDCLIQESERKAKALTSMQFDCQMTNSKIPLDFHPAICENKNGRQWKRGDVANDYGYKRFKSTICDICRFVAPQIGNRIRFTMFAGISGGTCSTQANTASSCDTILESSFAFSSSDRSPNFEGSST